MQHPELKPEKVNGNTSRPLTRDDEQEKVCRKRQEIITPARTVERGFN